MGYLQQVLDCLTSEQLLDYEDAVELYKTYGGD